MTGVLQNIGMRDRKLILAVINFQVYLENWERRLLGVCLELERFRKGGNVELILGFSDDDSELPVCNDLLGVWLNERIFSIFYNL